MATTTPSPRSSVPPPGLRSARARSDHDGAGRAPGPNGGRLARWKEVLRHTKDVVGKDHLAIMAAGVAFFGMLAIFPALIGVVSIYGLLFDPADIEGHIQSMSSALPRAATALLNDYLNGIIQTHSGALGLGALLGIVGALWSASSGTATTMKAINIAYDREDRRGFVRFRGTALALTLGIMLVVVVALSLLAVLPAAFGALGLPAATTMLLQWGRWPLLLFVGLLALGALYRFAASEAPPKWRRIAPGAVLAMLSWLLLSWGLAVYASNYASINDTYGPLASVIVLLFWLYLSAYVILLGAELNAELEARAADNESRRPSPSQRGAPQRSS